jgi:hypothetical protein
MKYRAMDDGTENERIKAWHRTFNAAFATLLATFGMDDAIRWSREAADKVHGAL